MTYAILDARELNPAELSTLIEELYRINLKTYHFYSAKYNRPIWQPAKIERKLIDEYQKLCLWKPSGRLEHYTASSEPRRLGKGYYSKIGVSGFASDTPRAIKRYIKAGSLNFLQNNLNKTHHPLHMIVEVPVDSSIVNFYLEAGFRLCDDERMVRGLLRLFSRVPISILKLTERVSYLTERSNVRNYLAVRTP